MANVKAQQLQVKRDSITYMGQRLWSYLCNSSFQPIKICVLYSNEPVISCNTSMCDCITEVII